MPRNKEVDFHPVCTIAQCNKIQYRNWIYYMSLYKMLYKFLYATFSNDIQLINKKW